jgi:hypothetical protein
VSIQFTPFDESADFSLIDPAWGISLASVSVSGGDLPPGTVPSLTFRSDTGLPPDGEGIWIAQEFAVPPGLSCLAYQGTTLVGTFTPAEASALRVNRLPSRAGWMPTLSGGHGMFTEFPGGTKLHADPVGIIDITSLVWDRGAGGAERISEITLEAGELTDSFAITGISFDAPCPADFNNDGSLDFFDYDDFVGAFEAAISTADFNNDGTIDFFDYNDFVGAFEAGC